MRAIIRRERDKPKTRKVGPLPYIFDMDKDEFEVDAADLPNLLHLGNFKQVITPRTKSEAVSLERVRPPHVTNDEFVSDVDTPELEIETKDVSLDESGGF